MCFCDVCIVESIQEGSYMWTEVSRFSCSKQEDSLQIHERFRAVGSILDREGAHRRHMLSE